MPAIDRSLSDCRCYKCEGMVTNWEDGHVVNLQKFEVSKNDELCIKNEEFVFITRNFALKMVNFAGLWRLLLVL